MSDLPTARPEAMPLALATSPFPTISGLEKYNFEEPQESIFRHYWRIFYRRRWIVLGVVASCLLLAILVSVLTKRQYTAVTTIQISREAAKVIDLESPTDQETQSLGPEFYQTQYALLKSRSLSEEVVRSLNLAENFDFLAEYDASQKDDRRSLPRERRLELAISAVNRNTSITPVRGSSIVNVGYEAPHPGMAAAVANELAEKFIETSLNRRFEASAYARQFLQNRLNIVRKRLEDSERRAAEYARSQGLIKIVSGGVPGESGQLSSEQSLASADLAQLSAQLSQARAARERAEADFRANSGGNAAASSLSNNAVNQLRGQRAQLTAELRKLESDFGPQYPRVVALRAQINELNRQISQEQGVVTSSVAQDLRDRFRQALAAEQGIQARVNQLKGAVLDQQQRTIQYNIIQRDVDTNRALYDALLQRFKEVGIAGGVGTNNVSIVDRGLPPKDPSSPNVPLNLALGLLLGLALGAGAALVLEQLAESMILPSDFQRKLGVPLLGSTPLTKSRVGEELGQERSALSEAYFSILTAVQFSTAKGAPTTLAVVSSQPNEGKSTTALALAKALATVGARVLLIDADMRNPSIHRLGGIANAKGLSDLLTRHAELDEVIRPSTVEGLSVVTAGPVPPNSAELLAGGGLEAVLKEAARRYDHVIVDTPPVMGLADAPAITNLTEGTLFVVEYGRTRSSQARAALDRLRAARAHVLGAVLTKLDAKASGYGYGYSYDYRYGTA